jgi:hypothetical protein
MLFGQPSTEVAIAGKAGGSVPSGFERRERRLRDAARHRRPWDVVTEGVLDAPLGIGRKPGGHTVSMDPKGRCDVLAVARLATRHPI